MLLPSAVHVSSTFEFTTMFHDCLSSDRQGNPPFSPFFGAPWKLLPSAVHVSSTFEFGAMFHDCLSAEPQGNQARSLWWLGNMFFCYFSDRFLRQTCVYVYMYIIFVVLIVFCILFCVVQQKRRSRDENRHHGKGRVHEISVLSLLSSYLWWEVSKEGQLSYPNFVRGL